MKFIHQFISWFKARKLITKSLLILLLLICSILFFGGSIAKYYVNKNGESLSGRKLHVNNISINYLTAGISIDDFTMYEVNKQDTFVHLGNGYVNMDLWKLFNNEFSFSQVEVNRLRVELIQGDSTFNFSDLVSDEPKDTTESPTHYRIRNLAVSNSSITYIDGPHQNTYPIHNMNMKVPELSWNGKESDIDLDFGFGESGKIGIDLQLDNVNNTYKVGLKTSNIDVKYGEVYLKDLFNINSLNGFIHSDLDISGDLLDATNISFKGTTSLTKVNIIDANGNPFSSIDSVAVLIDSANIQQYHFDFKETYLRRPVVHATLLQSSSNIEEVIKPVLGDGSVDTLNTSPEEATPFHFALHKTVIEDGEIVFSDKTLDRPFQYVLKDIQITTLNIADDAQNIVSDFSLNMNDKGSLSGNSIFNVVNTDNITFNAETKNVDLIGFSPYSEYYMASPITQGTFNYRFDLKMTSTQMINNNSFDIRELEFGKKLKSDSAYKVPVKLALILMKDKNDNIQFDIPVSGNPSDPNFKLFPIIWKTFGKFMVKAASSPVSAVASIAGTNPEDLEYIKFDYGQTEFNEKQKAILDKIIEIQNKKPNLSFSFIQMTDRDAEKSFIALQEAKKKFSPNEWTSLSDNDSRFKAYLRKETKNETGSVEDMAVQLIGKSWLQEKLTKIIADRNKTLSNYLNTNGEINDAFTVQSADFLNLPDELKKPQFKVEVSTP